MNEIKNINLGGFPPIFVLEKKIKNIKEFSSEKNKTIKNDNLLNVFNIKNILNSVKK
jgi:hypothetical protein